MVAEKDQLIDVGFDRDEVFGETFGEVSDEVTASGCAAWSS